MNIRNTTAKEKMLKKVRQALLHKRDNPFPSFEEKPLYVDEEEPLDVKFANEFSQLGGGFIYADGEISLIENLIVLIEKLKVSKIAVYDSSIQSFLNGYGFPFLADPTKISDYEVAISTCEALVARNGSVMVSYSDAASAKLQNFVPIQITFAKASQLVMDGRHGYQRILNKYEGKLPAVVTTLTGQSKTLLQKQEFVNAGFGSQKRFVFLLEDRF